MLLCYFTDLFWRSFAKFVEAPFFQIRLQKGYLVQKTLKKTLFVLKIAKNEKQIIMSYFNYLN